MLVLIGEVNLILFNLVTWHAISILHWCNLMVRFIHFCMAIWLLGQTHKVLYILTALVRGHRLESHDRRILKAS